MRKSAFVWYGWDTEGTAVNFTMMDGEFSHLVLIVALLPGNKILGHLIILSAKIGNITELNTIRSGPS